MKRVELHEGFLYDGDDLDNDEHTACIASSRRAWQKPS
jgi:hypothetical protein